MTKRVVFLMVTFLMASFITACATKGSVNNAAPSRGTAVERAR